jgi:hypothetical protein
MQPIRPLDEGDIPQVADLYQRVIGTHAGPSSPELQSHMQDVFLRNPWIDKRLPSLVYQQQGEKITGFLGVIPRRMVLKGRTVRVAVSTSFVVDPSSRHTLAGIQLLKTFFQGPQDLSLTDGANDPSRKVWEALGGRAVPLYSIYWTRPLRFMQYTTQVVKKKRERLAPLLSVLRPISMAVDAVAARMHPNNYTRPPAQILREACEAKVLLECIQRFCEGESLLPAYDVDSLRWLLDMAAHPIGKSWAGICITPSPAE